MLHLLTCSPEERGSGRWRGRTSRLCPPSSSTKRVGAATAEARGPSTDGGDGGKCTPSVALLCVSV